MILLRPSQIIESGGQICTVAWLKVVLRQKNRNVSLLKLWPRVWPEKLFPATTPETWERINTLLGDDFAKATSNVSPSPPLPCATPSPSAQSNRLPVREN